MKTYKNKATQNDKEQRIQTNIHIKNKTSKKTKKHKECNNDKHGNIKHKKVTNKYNDEQQPTKIKQPKNE